MKKVYFLLILPFLCGISCNYNLTFTPTKLENVAVKQVSKILVVEQSDAKTTDFFNRLRKEMLIEMKRSKNVVALDFVRLLSTDENRAARHTAALSKNQNDAILVFTPGDRKTYKFGVLRNSVRRLHLQAELIDSKSQQKLWAGEFYLDNKWGADVSTDKLAIELFRLWRSAGIIAGEN